MQSPRKKKRETTYEKSHRTKDAYPISAFATCTPCTLWDLWARLKNRNDNLSISAEKQQILKDQKSWTNLRWQSFWVQKAQKVRNM